MVCPQGGAKTSYITSMGHLTLHVTAQASDWLQYQVTHGPDVICGEAAACGVIEVCGLF